MPDPLSLKVGDLVRFTAIPEEWSRPGYRTHKMTISFMRRMINRSWPSRVCSHCHYGYPIIRAIMVVRGRREYHSYLITETDGWRSVKRRGKSHSRATPTP